MKTSVVTPRPKILVTDSLFILDHHIQQLNAAGYEVERLDKPDATEAELIAAIHGKVGYILGGSEYITDPVIQAAKDLRAIVLAGTDWRHFIPAHAEATARGIKLANAPGGVSYAAAEYTLMLMLVMLRRLYDIAPPGRTGFLTTASLSDQRVGIIGMGQVPQHLLPMLAGFRLRQIKYANRSRHPEVEKHYGISYASVEDVLRTSDVVCLHVPSAIGDDYMDAAKLALMPDKSILIDTSFDGALDLDAAYAEVSSGRLRIAHDGNSPDGARFAQVPLTNWLSSNAHTGYNTEHSRRVTSDLATATIINLLKTGKDQYSVR